MNFDKKIATRDGFGDEIVALGKENRNILVVDADIGKSCKTGAVIFVVVVDDSSKVIARGHLTK